MTYLAMQRGEWFTLLLALGLHVVVFICTFFVRETLKRHPDPAHDESNAAPSKSLKEALKAPLTTTALSIRTLFWANTKLSILFFVMFFGSVGKYMSRLLLRQYVAKRFHFTWAEVSIPRILLPPFLKPMMLASTGNAMANFV